jgi:hypothetical protein
VTRSCDVLIIGDSLGACAAAWQLGRLGLKTIMLSDHDWIGGQLTSQLTPPDEHPWIEKFGCTAGYRELRNRIRQHYYTWGGLSLKASFARHLNPGGGWVSRLCAEPRVCHDVLRGMLTPYVRNKKLEIIRVSGRGWTINGSKEQIESVVAHTANAPNETIEAKYYLDATETGSVLPLAKVEHVVGAESKSEFGEPHALDVADEECRQPETHCAVLEWHPDEDFTVPENEDYAFWSQHQPPHWPGPIFSWTYPDGRSGKSKMLPLFKDNGWDWFTYRQIVDPDLTATEFRRRATVVNWPQNDFVGPCLETKKVPELDVCTCSRNMTLSFIRWMQVEEDFKSLRPAPEHSGAELGLAQAPYIRESRRIKAMETLTELEVAADCNPGLKRAKPISNSVGIGAYPIDIHPRINGMIGIDVQSLPYQIPLGCLIPRDFKNLLPACKNIGVTHIANGCTRLHPIEWNIGESSAILAAYCIRESIDPKPVWGLIEEREKLQKLMLKQGVELDWPKNARLKPL